TQNATGTSPVTVTAGSFIYNSTVAGALALANTVTLASGANISNRNTGNLTLNAATVLPTTGTAIFDSDDQSTAAAGIFIQAGVTLTGPLTIQVGGNNANVGFVNILGVVNAGANALTKTQPGTLRLANVSAATPNTFTGTVTVTGGTLEAYSTQAANTDSLGAAGVVLNGGTFQVNPVPSTFAGGASLFGRFFNFGLTPTNATTGTNQADFSGPPAATRNETGALNYAAANPSTLQPAGVNATNFGADWVGGLNILTGGIYNFQYV